MLGVKLSAFLNTQKWPERQFTSVQAIFIAVYCCGLGLGRLPIFTCTVTSR
jgi:hypothetical protein